MTTADVLRAAKAHIIDPSKWCTGSLCDSQGRFCALGAVARVVLGDHFPDTDTTYDALDAHPAVHALAAAVGRSPSEGENTCDVVYVANDDGRESAEHHATVLDLFDRAIALSGE